MISELDLVMVASLRLLSNLINRSHPMQVFNVQGMSCGHCVKTITQALQAKDPAASVRIDLAANEVGVESALTAEQVIAAITEEGYEAKVA
jgi:copper chaperone